MPCPCEHDRPWTNALSTCRAINYFDGFSIYYYLPVQYRWPLDEGADDPEGEVVEGVARVGGDIVADRGAVVEAKRRLLHAVGTYCKKHHFLKFTGPARQL